jgi:pantoate kinase
MTLPRKEADKLARSLLAKQGIGAIWRLHQAAAAAHRAGFPFSAADLIEVADAAERAWMNDARRKGGLADVIASLR